MRYHEVYAESHDGMDDDEVKANAVAAAQAVQAYRIKSIEADLAEGTALNEKGTDEAPGVERDGDARGAGVARPLDSGPLEPGHDEGHE